MAFKAQAKDVDGNTHVYQLDDERAYQMLSRYGSMSALKVYVDPKTGKARAPLWTAGDLTREGRKLAGKKRNSLTVPQALYEGRHGRVYHVNGDTMDCRMANLRFHSAEDAQRPAAQRPNGAPKPKRRKVAKNEVHLSEEHRLVWVARHGRSEELFLNQSEARQWLAERLVEDL